jgi:hypothetical protein
MKFIAAVFVLACLCAAPLSAQTVFFDGAIGKSLVFGSLSRDGDHLMGWYLYTKYEKQIELSGKIDAKGTFHLGEMDFDSVKGTGAFDGQKTGAMWIGTWRDVKGGASIPFSFRENRDTLSKLNGDFRCSERHTDKKYGYTYTRSAQVTFVHGVLKRMDLTQDSRGTDGDEQSCSIALSDLNRVRSDEGGVLLRAKGDDPDQPNTSHCTVHIAGNANFLYVSPGDTAEEGNDCKGAADVMFCSPRANFGDFLIDRSGVCKPKD